MEKEEKESEFVHKNVLHFFGFQMTSYDQAVPPNYPSQVNNTLLICLISFLRLPFLFIVILDCEIPANIVFVMDESGSIRYHNYQKEKKFVRSVYKCYKKFSDIFRFGYSRRVGATGLCSLRLLSFPPRTVIFWPCNRISVDHSVSVPTYDA